MLVVQTLAGRISRQISASAQQQLGQSPGDKLEQTEGRNRAPLLFSTRAVPEPQTTSKDTACLSRCLLGWGAPKCELQAPSPGQVIPLQELPNDSEASKHCNSRTTLSFFSFQQAQPPRRRTTALRLQETVQSMVNISPWTLCGGITVVMKGN